MGNCFGKEKDSGPGGGDNFQTPGRTLGGPAPTGEAARAKVPAAISSPGRTLGASTSAGSGDDPKTAAARAAEERRIAAQSQAKGKLGKQLDAQKARTQEQTRTEASRENRQMRNADSLAETRAYN